MVMAFKKFASVPEENGVIMIIEKEFGPAGAKDWVNLAAKIVDMVKITSDTEALYKQDVPKKIKVHKDASIDPMVGETVTEVTALRTGGHLKANSDKLRVELEDEKIKNARFKEREKSLNKEKRVIKLMEFFSLTLIGIGSSVITSGFSGSVRNEDIYWIFYGFGWLLIGLGVLAFIISLVM